MQVLLILVTKTKNAIPSSFEPVEDQIYEEAIFGKMSIPNYKSVSDAILSDWKLLSAPVKSSELTQSTSGYTTYIWYLVKEVFKNVH
jgi:hypothetical protein